ncbi:MAG: immunoglobulin domain-containing protein [Planctomycetes bacterium]|nr:immunoglobulin domain-containing protein [Planctomycetota bacterium]
MMSRLMLGFSGVIFRASCFLGSAVATTASAQTGGCQTGWLAGSGVPGMNASVYAMTVWDPDGTGPLPPRLVVGGYFTSAGGVPANRIASLNLATGEWSALGAGLNGAVSSLAILPSGSLVAGGSFTTAGGVNANRVAVWNGSAWSALGSGLGPSTYGVTALAIMANGNIVAGGDFTSSGSGVTVNRVARWTGSAWVAMGTGMNDRVNCLAVSTNGIVVAGGKFTSAGGAGASRIAQWNGTSWSAMGAGMSMVFGFPFGTPPAVNALAAIPNGEVVAAGWFDTAGTSLANSVAKWNGSTWSPLGRGIPTSSGFEDMVFCLTALPGGDLIAGGNFSSYPGEPGYDISRWNGSTWTSLGGGVGIYSFGGGGEVRGVAALPDGDIVAGGSFTYAGGSPVSNFARYTYAVPSIWSSPASRTVAIGQPTTLSVTAAGPAAGGPAQYQWRKDGVRIAGANAANLTIAAVSASHAGLYDVVVRNTCGQVVSAPAALNRTIPTIRSVFVTGISSAGATVNWTTDRPAQGAVRWGASPGALSSLTAFTTLGTSGARTISAVAGFYYQVVVRDAQGAEALSDVRQAALPNPAQPTTVALDAGVSGAFWGPPLLACASGEASNSLGLTLTIRNLGASLGGPGVPLTVLGRIQSGGYSAFGLQPPGVVSCQLPNPLFTIAGLASGGTSVTSHTIVDARRGLSPTGGVGLFSGRVLVPRTSGGFDVYPLPTKRIQLPQ